MTDAQWFKKAIIYHILIDRFAGFKTTQNWDKPNFLGGNIKGITQKIPYLKKLGINTLWISPFYKTTEYHGYHITDFYQVDPHFGTITDIKELTKQVHKQNMKIIADFVPNHCSKEHPYFKEAQQNKKSRYKKWFYFKKWPNKYHCFLSIKELPKINLKHEPAKEHITNAALYWLKQGFNGYRIDHVIGPPNTYWKHLTKQIKKEYPETILIGEAWMKGVKFHELNTIKMKGKYTKWLTGSNSDKLLKEYIGLLDGVLDFRFQEIMRKEIAWTQKPSIKNIKKLLKKHYKKYPENYYMPTFLDNHDMNRFLYESKNNIEKLVQTAEIQFTTKQPPIIYYGTETGLRQQKSIWSIKSHGDLQARQPMNWDEINEDILTYYQKMIKNR